jgi:hypothetical protein
MGRPLQHLEAGSANFVALEVTEDLVSVRDRAHGMKGHIEVRF